MVENIDLKKLKPVIMKYTLYNAYIHNGKAQPPSVLGKILAESPEYRTEAIEILKIIKSVVEEVNSLSRDEQLKRIEIQWPELLEAKDKTEKKALQPLPNTEKYSKIVTRFSPNPDCVLHLGSARALVLSWKYAKIYKGDFYLRFEDTDPRQKRPVLEFYDKIREDLLWLGCKWDREIIQSDRIDIYYEYAEKLLKQGSLYVCTCNPEVFRQLISEMKACNCRDQPPEVQLERWNNMKDGVLAEGAAVVRVKSDLNHRNPAVRDWPALRIVDTKRFPHPRVGDKYRVWPLYNFSCGLDDHLLGITHVIRGKEHLTNEVRQKYLYKYLGWEYPDAVQYGRLKITDALLSKSLIKKGIEDGTFSDYEDPKLATLMALRKRGIEPEAIIEMMIDVGMKPVDVSLSWDTLYAHNRKIIETVSSRYFFVSNPVELEIEKVEKIYYVELALHPDHPERGKRTFRITPINKSVNLFISSQDLKLFQQGAIIRLMGLFNIKVKQLNKKILAAYHSENYDDVRKMHAPIIHYLAPNNSFLGEIKMPDGKAITGLVENSCRELEIHDIVQFERFGFVKINAISSNKLTAYFTHK